MPISSTPPAPAATPRQVLFVCTGNICRSPMAEHLLRHHLGGTGGWTVASAGLFAVPGLPASAAAVDALREKGIPLDAHRSRPVTPEMVDAAALLVVMTEAHAAELKRRFPQARDRVRLLKSFDPAAGGADVHDPLGGGAEVYRRIRDEIDACLLDLILWLRRGAGGSRPAAART